MTTASTRDGLGDQLRAGRKEVRDIGEELAGITEDFRQLARTEAELAKAEMSEQLHHAIRMALWGGIALLGVFITLFFAGMTLMYGLAVALPLWVAALVTTLILLAVVGTMAFLARAELKAISIVPKRTLRSFQEDVRWAKAQLKSNPTSSGSGGL